MDTNDRQKVAWNHRVNWLDIGIAVLAIVLAAFLVVKYFSAGGNRPVADGKVTIEYTVQIDKLDADVSLSLAGGDSVVDMESKVSLGELAANPMITAYQENIYNEQSGGIEIVNSEKYVTVYLTVSAVADESAYGYYVNGVRIAVESMMDIRIAGLEAEGKCIGIEIKSGNQEG